MVYKRLSLFNYRPVSGHAYRGYRHTRTQASKIAWSGLMVAHEQRQYISNHNGWTCLKEPSWSLIPMPTSISTFTSTSCKPPCGCRTANTVLIQAHFCNVLCPHKIVQEVYYWVCISIWCLAISIYTYNRCL